MNADESSQCQDGDQESIPEIYRIAELTGTESTTRRKFVIGTLKALGSAALLSHITGCEESELDVVTVSGNCTCHVVDTNNPPCTCETVCTCHSVSGSGCVCNTVCTCDTVGGHTEDKKRNCPSYCTCHNHCTCNSQGGGGGGGSHYWYPC